MTSLTLVRRIKAQPSIVFEAHEDSGEYLEVMKPERLSMSWQAGTPFSVIEGRSP
jgi:uncharacterized protein YndB with AHSA1/START domain